MKWFFLLVFFAACQKYDITFDNNNVRINKQFDEINRPDSPYKVRINYVMCDMIYHFIAGKSMSPAHGALIATNVLSTAGAIAMVGGLVANNNAALGVGVAFGLAAMIANIVAISVHNDRICRCYSEVLFFDIEIEMNKKGLVVKKSIPVLAASGYKLDFIYEEFFKQMKSELKEMKKEINQ